eukprot:6373565-Prymnesium_polylepis.1
MSPAVRLCRAGQVVCGGLFTRAEWMPSDAAVFGSEVVQLCHDHSGVGLSDSTSSTGDIIRAL